jgi:hypothetical protein
MIGASVVDKAQSGKLTHNHKDGGDVILPCHFLGKATL